MKKTVFWSPLHTGMQFILLLAISVFSVGTGSTNVAHAKPLLSTDTEQGTACDQLLADAEAAFKAALAPDGSVPANAETKAAAQEYIRVSKLCYEEIEADAAAETLQEDTPTFIDEGGIRLGGENSADFLLRNTKWGYSGLGTPGGTVTYSFMGNGISFNAEGYGNSTAITSLPGFQACFITDIQMAFAAWQAVSNIEFVQVTDSATAFNAQGATGDIRIGAHYFDGPSNNLAHAYFPPPNGYSAAGDLHFDSSENWKCNTTGIDIGIVALHEIGHSIGLDHDNTAAVAVMDPYYNPTLAGLQPDDRNGITAIYGPAQLSSPPGNDDITAATPFNGTPYINSINATGATQSAGDAFTIGPCGTATGDRTLQRGNQTVWYRYAPSVTKQISLDTNGSSYDTYIAVWSGTIGALNLVKCNEDTFEGIEGKLSFTGTAGTTYYIEIGSFSGYVGVGQPTLDPSQGANLEFHATSFEDVRSNFWAWRFIEGLYKAGVTSGCSSSPMQYCPATTVTRDQMAVFLLRAKHGSNYSPPAAKGVFLDVPINHWAAPWIERLAAEGITAGCGGGNYCPAIPVTRDQMAVFLLRSEHGSGYGPPLATGVFQDVPANHWAAAWIEQLAAEGITGGCGSGNYCPATPVTRDQMAVFLDRTFDIPLLP